MQPSTTKRYTLLGLFIAFALGPIIITGYALSYPGMLTNWIVASRELLLLLAAATLILLIVKGEKRGLDSVGLHNRHWGKSLLLSLFILVTSSLVAFGCLLLLNAVGVSYGQGGEANRYNDISLWVITLMVMRAGFVEEFFYRGYIMERLAELTGRWIVYFLLPAVIFGLLHFRQGLGGVLIAFVLGLVFAVFYWKYRDLKAVIIAHFLVDFIPNVLLPLFQMAPHTP